MLTMARVQEGDQMSRAVSELVLRHRVHVVSAVGNDASAWSVYTPSVSPDAISVAAAYQPYMLHRRFMANNQSFGTL